MKRIIIFLPIFITCHVSQDQYDKPNFKYAIKSGSTRSIRSNTDTEEVYEYQREPLQISEGLLDVCLSGHIITPTNHTCHLTWMKSNVQDIIGPDGKPSPVFQGKFKYSYAVAPIKNNENYSKYVMPLILFESLVDYVKIVSFKLTNHKELNLDFRNGHQQATRDKIANELEVSTKKLGYKGISIYGELYAYFPNGGDGLITAFSKLYQNGDWYFMSGEITIEDTLSRETTTHTILLDAQLFNEFLKIVIAKHPETKTANNRFRVPVS
ncbi:p23 cell envelope protein (plasmid) [Borrelia puertoricensis]|uniref:BB0158 famile outer surface lipoprotein n=1 Tax=Borrelia puertoricensis TaxID=2756107 RepID=UPI001FF0E630|nr:p23 cell envelope protein [Borrelia puertoricensis]UPA18976.1 p23 cell envelope protein [Borrelia puertoricensis]